MQLSWPTITADYFSSSTAAAVKRTVTVLCRVSKGKSKVTQPHQSYIDPELCVSSYNTHVRATGKRANHFGRVTIRSHAFPEDAGQRTRSGRVIMKSFRYWAGEGYIWKRGMVEGVLLASGPF